ncbi:hypothetical protein ABBQ32_005248 [Trebouxia sp. C0010 RCD-2024]
MGTILQRLDAEIVTFTDSFANLVKASRIDNLATNKPQATRVPGDLLEVLAEKLVLSGQLLISMLEELKRNAALSNFAALNSNIAQHDVAYREKAAQLHAELAVLQQQLMDQQARAEPDNKESAE